jgi:hypothetical protein
MSSCGVVHHSSVWPNVVPRVFEHSNEGRPNYSVKLSRSFRRDEESEWESTEYLGVQDLLPAARLLGEAYDAIQARQDEAFRGRQQAG